MKIALSMCLVAFGFLTGGCVQDRSNGVVSTNSFKIVNGELVQDRSSISLMTVGIYKDNTVMCTGVLVDKDTVVTAAHCESEVKGGRVVFGIDHAHFQYRQITNYRVHEEYHDNVPNKLSKLKANDILVLKFVGGLPEGYTAAQLPDEDLISVGQKVILAGYGFDENKDSDKLKSTAVEVDELTENEFKTNELRNGSCNGDSGGPVFVDTGSESYTWVGIVSRGDVSCSQNGIYQNIYYYSDWLMEKLTDPNFTQ